MKNPSPMPEYRRMQSISLRLLFLVVLCSSCFTLMASAFQLYFYYTDDVASIHDNMALLQKSYLPPIASSLYSLDYEQLDLLLKSVIQLRDMEYIEILESRKGNKLMRSVGNSDAREDIVREFPLEHLSSALNVSYRVGTLRVTASFENIYRRTLEKAFVVIATNAAKMFLTSFCILMIFQSVITRHLAKIATFTQQMVLKKQYTPLALDRKVKTLSKSDEFDQVVWALNNLLGRVSQDIDGREKSGKALRESEERFRYLSNASTEAIFFTKDGLALEANQAAADMFGFDDPSELIGIFATEVIAPESHEVVKEHMLNNLTTPYEATGKRKDGSQFPISIRSRVIQYRNKETVRATSIIDITAQRQAEEEKANLETQLQKSQKMETIGTLAGGIAHEFNNLLYMILGTAELMKLDADKENQGLLQEIIESTQRGADLVKQLMAFSRKSEMNLNTTSMNIEIQRIKKMLDRVLPRMIDIKLDLTKNLFHIKADQGQIEQVILNLCFNAKDAMPDGGSLTIKTENTIIDKPPGAPMGLKNGNCIVLTISDTGTGMDEKTREHIFDPFFTTKDVGKGTGLGLSVIYGIVEGHGGDISCESEPGAGTTFKIFFPATSDDHADLSPDNIEYDLSLKGTETILFVDDEKTIVKVMEATFNRLGYTTYTANSGESALEIYIEKHVQIDLVVLDLGMPGMGGKKCLETLIEFDKDAKVIVASGYSDEGSVKDTGDKAKAFILKPFTNSKVIQLIRDVLDE